MKYYYLLLLLLEFCRAQGSSGRLRELPSLKPSEANITENPSNGSSAFTVLESNSTTTEEPFPGSSGFPDLEWNWDESGFGTSESLPSPTPLVKTTTGYPQYSRTPQFTGSSVDDSTTTEEPFFGSSAFTDERLPWFTHSEDLPSPSSSQVTSAENPLYGSSASTPLESESTTTKQPFYGSSAFTDEPLPWFTHSENLPSPTSSQETTTKNSLYGSSAFTPLESGSTTTKQPFYGSSAFTDEPLPGFTSSEDGPSPTAASYSSPLESDRTTTKRRFWMKSHVVPGQPQANLLRLLKKLRHRFDRLKLIFQKIIQNILQ